MKIESIIAIDIVLLPPKNITELCVRLKRESAAGKELPFFLNTKDRLPHVTLLQGFVLKTSVPILSHILEQISRKTKKLPLTIHELAEEKSMHFVLEIKNTSAVQKLHELILRKCAPSLLPEGDPASSFILDPHEERVSESSYAWPLDFLNTSSHKKYNPHITLGDANVRPTVSFPINFTASTLAICQMGTSGTCRKVFAQWELQ